MSEPNDVSNAAEEEDDLIPIAQVPDKPAVRRMAASKSSKKSTDKKPATEKFTATASKKCPVCEKSVFKAEEIICNGASWHKTCFACGTPGDLGCKRVLTGNNYNLQNGLPYCKGCFLRIQQLHPGTVAENLPTLKRDVSIRAVAVTADAAAGQHLQREDVAKLTATVKVSARASNFISAKPASGSSAGGSGGDYKPFSTNLGKINKCPLCDKTVFKMEEVIGVGAAWHKSCFVCGGTGDVGCKRVLASENYLQHNGLPYCKACFNRHFKVAGSLTTHFLEDIKKRRSSAPKTALGDVRKMAAKFERKEKVSVTATESTDEASPAEAETEVEAEVAVDQDTADAEVDADAAEAAEILADADSRAAIAEALRKKSEAELEDRLAREAEDAAEKLTLEEQQAEEGEEEEEGQQQPEEEEEEGEKEEEEEEGDGDDDQEEEEGEEGDGDDDQEEEEGEEGDGDDDQELDLDDVALGVDVGAGVSEVTPKKPQAEQAAEEEPEAPVEPAAVVVAVEEEEEKQEEEAEQPVPPPGPRTTLLETFVSPFDENGVLTYIATSGHSKPYQNPQLSGAVRVTMSSIYKGRLHTVVERTNAAMPNYTNNTRNSWVMLDLGESVRLTPTRYCLRHGGSGKGNGLRNWELRARQNVTDHWTLLRSHQKDDALSDYPCSTASWKLTPKAQTRSPTKKGSAGGASDTGDAAYRYFLIVQVGPNSSGNDCLFIGGIDFYGTLTEYPSP